MRDILTITLNPAVDLATSTARVSPGPKLRCDRPEIDPGGGGINVSRAIRILGGQSTSMVAVGGHTGDHLMALLTAEGISCVPLQAPGQTRQSLSVMDKKAGQQYRFVMPGPEWSLKDFEHIEATLSAAPVTEGYAVISGSQPPGVPADGMVRLCKALGSPDVRLIVDVSGAALESIITHPPEALYVLRMDQDEAEILNGASLPDRADTGRFAATLVSRGIAQSVIVARGADGSVMANADGVWHASSVDVPVNSKVGAGDSFVGAFTLALAQDDDAGVALQRATAAACSAVTTDATQLCKRQDAERFLPQCHLSALTV